MIQSLLEKVLAEAAPKSNKVRLKLVDGVEVEFRILTDMAERIPVEQESIRWAKSFQKQVASGTTLEAWKPFETDHLGVLSQVKMLSLLAITPECQSELFWMALAKRAAPVFAGTVAALDAAAANESSEWGEYIEEKKDSPEASTESTSAELASNTTESGTTT